MLSETFSVIFKHCVAVVFRIQLRTNEDWKNLIIAYFQCNLLLLQSKDFASWTNAHLHTNAFLQKNLSFHLELLKELFTVYSVSFQKLESLRISFLKECWQGLTRDFTNALIFRLLSIFISFSSTLVLEEIPSSPRTWKTAHIFHFQQKACATTQWPPHVTDRQGIQNTKNGEKYPLAYPLAQQC